MKKNRMMRLASILLVCVLMTTSVISGTFAKYTTQDAANDTARVAKWGVTLQVAGKLFGETYKDTIVASDDTALTVQANDYSSANDFVVAPGTKSDDGFHISLTGTPEVDSQAIVKITAQNIFLNAGTYGLMVEVPAGTITKENFTYITTDYDTTDTVDNHDEVFVKSGDAFTPVTSWDSNWQDDPTFYTLEDKVDTTTLGTYYPVVYAMTGDTSYTGDDSKDTIKEIANTIAAKFGTATETAASSGNKNTTTYEVTSAVIDSNTDLDTAFAIGDIEITWAWAFNGTNSGNSASTEDKADTILGLLMTRLASGTDPLDGTVVKLSNNSYVAPVENTDFCLDTSFSIDITVNQVD